MTRGGDLVEQPRLLMVMPYKQFVHKAKAAGFWVGAIWDPRLESDAYLAEVRDLADAFVLADFRDPHDFQAVIRSAAAAHDASIIYHIGQEDTMVAAYEVAEELHRERNPATAIRCLADKGAMRALLARHGLSPVRFASVSDRGGVPEAVRRIGYPAVVKPAARSGSRGVYLWQADGDGAGWVELVDQYGDQGPFLVEEYLSGPEYSVETLSQDGRHLVVGITEKLLGPPPLFVEVGHTHPAVLDDGRAEAIARVAMDLLTVCGYRFGPAHTEVIWTASGPRIVESQARLGGDRIPRLIELASGFDIEQAIFDAMAGARLDAAPVPERTAMVRFFTFPSGGVEEVRGIDRARQFDFVDELTLRLAPGGVAPEVRDSKSRHGHVIVHGSSPEEAQRRCAEVVASIEAVVDGAVTHPDGRVGLGLHA